MKAAQKGRVWTLNRVGTEDYVEVLNEEVLNPEKNGQMTLSGWVYLKSYPVNSAQQRAPIVEKGNANEGWQWALYIYSDGVAGLSLWQTPSPQGHIEIRGGHVPLNEWHFISGVYNFPSAAAVYIDGIEVARSNSFNGTGQIIGTAPVQIGARTDGMQYVHAKIDEVRIWNIARAQDAIIRTMNTQLTGTEAGLVGYWNFDDGTPRDLTPWGRRRIRGICSRDCRASAPSECRPSRKAAVARQLSQSVQPRNLDTLPLGRRCRSPAEHLRNGALVRQFSLGYQRAGYYQDWHTAVYWNGRNESGEAVSSGVYFYQLETGNFSAVRRMVILK